MSEGFLLQMAMAVLAAGGVYGAIRADLTNIKRSLDEERRLREEHSRDDDQTHHNIRGEIQEVKIKTALLEGKQIMALDLLDAVRGRNEIN